MPVVRVWNRNEYTLKEMFKGDPIEIKPGEFKEMEKEDAYLFKGQYVPIMLNAGGQQDPRSFKMLHIEELMKSAPQAMAAHTCMSCKYQAGSKKELELHLTSQHADAMRLELEEGAPAAEVTPTPAETKKTKRAG